MLISMNRPSKKIRFLRLPAVKEITGLSRSSIYDRMKDGTFPTTVKLGGRAVGWIEDEVSQWAADRVAEARPPNLQPVQRAA